MKFSCYLGTSLFYLHMTVGVCLMYKVINLVGIQTIVSDGAR